MKIRPTAPAAAKSRAKSATNTQPSDAPALRKRRRLTIDEGGTSPPPPRRGRHAFAKPPADAPMKGLARLRFQTVQIDLIKLPTAHQNVFPFARGVIPFSSNLV